FHGDDDAGWLSGKEAGPTEVTHSFDAFAIGTIPNEKRADASAGAGPFFVLADVPRRCRTVPIAPRSFATVLRTPCAQSASTHAAERHGSGPQSNRAAADSDSTCPPG